MKGLALYRILPGIFPGGLEVWRQDGQGRIGGGEAFAAGSPAAPPVPWGVKLPSQAPSLTVKYSCPRGRQAGGMREEQLFGW